MTTETKTPTTREIPARACQLTVGELQFGDNGEDAKSAPIKLLARSSEPVNHWFFGKVAHDMEGMQLSKDRLPVDYCHMDTEVIGYLNQFNTDDGQLETTGALVPFKDSDRATEIIHKQKLGVPYEASIDFRGPSVIEEVSAGAFSEVNGKTFEGPGIIFRQWTLRGVAVCPYGVDSNTSSEVFADDKTSTISVKVMQMSDNAQDVEAQEAVETETLDNKEVEAQASESEAVDASPTDDRAELKRFMEAFPEKGHQWYAEGLTFEDATARFAKELAEENAALRQKVDSLDLGEQEAAEFSASESEQDKPTKFADFFRIKD